MELATSSPDNGGTGRTRDGLLSAAIGIVPDSGGRGETSADVLPTAEAMGVNAGTVPTNATLLLELHPTMEI